jgi:2-hydroxychromene-2-carboxylate isomerase
MSKVGLAALEATLLVYRFGEPKRDIPILRAIWTAPEELEEYEMYDRLAAAARLTKKQLEADVTKRGIQERLQKPKGKGYTGRV